MTDVLSHEQVCGATHVPDQKPAKKLAGFCLRNVLYFGYNLAMPQTPEQKQQEAVDRILQSPHPKKIIVAGAGAGKTTVFKKLLNTLPEGQPEKRVAITFINGLRDDLEKDLGQLSKVHTFHGYCHHLLRQQPALRGTDLTGRFFYFPKLAKLIISDWFLTQKGAPPKFVTLLRNLKEGDELNFFLQRGTYYDAISFDDSVYRVHQALSATGAIPEYELVIVDEVQDFNLAEISVIELLAAKSKTVLAGDDDQALYGQLRDASEDHIRRLYVDMSCEALQLPFCMRCTSVIVEAVNDIVRKALSLSLLGNRIEKEYLPFPAAKGEDDRKYPKINIVHTSVQSSKPPASNYFGRYIEQQINLIPADEIEESHRKGFPTALIIAVNPHADAVSKYLEAKGIHVQTKDRSADDIMGELTHDDGFGILKNDPDSNLGWRILLELDRPEGFKNMISESVSGKDLIGLLPPDYKAAILAKVLNWVRPAPASSANETLDPARPTVKMTSFEGAKGLSAHHVFILGLHEGEFPKNALAIKDQEIRRFIVALTRTRKQCHLLYSTRLIGKSRRPSAFLQWIASERMQFINVNKEYWASK